MPLYTYKGFDVSTGATRKGKIEAESAKAARAKIKQRLKVIVSELKEEAPAKQATNKRSMFQKKVSTEDVSIMTRQFATLQNAHVPIDESLKALMGQVENVVLRNTMSALKDDVSEGKGLGEAMGAFPGVFSRLYVNMVKAGESSGSLGAVLERLADFMEYQVKMRGQVISAMAYPAIMIIAATGIIAFLFVSIVPKLQKVFTSLKVDLPWYSQMLINLSEFIQSNLILLLLSGVVVGLGIRYWLSTESGKSRFDRWILKMPAFGQIVMRTNVSNFTRTLSTLLNSGVPIIEALTITKNTIGNTVIANVIDEAKTAVQEGESLGLTIERSGRFPALVTHMIKTGEQTGELEQMLSHVADAYESEVQRKIATMISLIEPLMIIVMGLVAVVVVAALMIPMLSVMSKIR